MVRLVGAGAEALRIKRRKVAWKLLFVVVVVAGFVEIYNRSLFNSKERDESNKVEYLRICETDEGRFAAWYKARERLIEKSSSSAAVRPVYFTEISISKKPKEHCTFTVTGLLQHEKPGSKVQGIPFLVELAFLPFVGTTEAAWIVEKTSVGQ